MRRLYLHVGLHKTGTSYLQRLLVENRALLAEAGLGLGPYQDPVSGSHHPILAAIEREGPEAVFARASETPGERLLISAEELSEEMNARPGYLAAIHAAAARHFEPHLVIFLRRQDFLKESVYAEAVKDWFAGSIHDDHHYDYDHAARIARLEAVFGPARVHVTLYRDPGPNDIVGDLLAATGTAIDRARLTPVPRQNVSMHRRKTLFLGQMPKPPRGPRRPGGAGGAALRRPGARRLGGGRRRRRALPDVAAPSATRSSPPTSPATARWSRPAASPTPGPSWRCPTRTRPGRRRRRSPPPRSPRSGAPPSSPASGAAATRSPPPGWRRRSRACSRRWPAASRGRPAPTPAPTPGGGARRLKSPAAAGMTGPGRRSE